MWYPAGDIVVGDFEGEERGGKNREKLLEKRNTALHNFGSLYRTQ